MISSINSNNSNWLNVFATSGSGTFAIDNSKVQQGIAGQVRHTGNNFEVNDGMTWRPLYDSYATVDLTKTAEEAFQWTVRQMAREREVEELAQNSAAVAAALNEYKSVLAIAQERLGLVVNLAKEHA
jgi:hypothetical protein